MCFAPQRRALFGHLNFQKSSDTEVFCTFSLGNVLRATTACTFSTSQLPKVVRQWCVLYILTWKCASRHNGVQFFISHLASWLRTRRFSEPTFRPSGAPNHWKNVVFRDFPTFSRICIFFLLTLSLLLFFLLIFLFSLPLPCSAFHLSILSEVWILNFLRFFIYIYMRICVYVYMHGLSIYLFSHVSGHLNLMHPGARWLARGQRQADVRGEQCLRAQAECCLKSLPQFALLVQNMSKMKETKDMCLCVFVAVFFSRYSTQNVEITTAQQRLKVLVVKLE